MNSKPCFLFYHYGKIPNYLEHAIEHTRIFNPLAEIFFISSNTKNLKNVDCFNIKRIHFDSLISSDLIEFRENYKHLSGFDKQYEIFCFERWFFTEEIRKKNPDRTFIMVDSDVAVFGDLANLIPNLPDCAISIAGNCPHLTFVKGSLREFLNFVIEHYKDPQKLTKIDNLQFGGLNDDPRVNLSDMTFLQLFLNESSGIKNFNKETDNGFVDTNIHLTEGFESLSLRRRPRKKIFWRMEEGRAIPYFKRGNEFVKALALHFQGPGKRVFHRFNSIAAPPSALQIWWWNQIFQKQWLANLM